MPCFGTEYLAAATEGSADGRARCCIKIDATSRAERRI